MNLKFNKMLFYKYNFHH